MNDPDSERRLDMLQGIRLQRALVRSSMTPQKSLRRLKVLQRTLSSTRPTPAIQVDRPDALIDQPVSINVSGLDQGQKVTLSAILKDGGKELLSCGHYTADDGGRIDCCQQPSEGGTFQGVEPMGLFWSMVQGAKHKRPIRLLKKDVTTPYIISISVLRNHRDLTFIQSESATSDVLASTNVKRWYLGKEVKRLPVRAGRLRGVIFVPAGEGPFPAVIDLFGGSGGLFDFRGALLASRGFLTLSLAYLYYEGLTPDLSDVQFTYFQEAVDWLHSHPMAIQNGVGVIGTSFGGAMAYLLSVFCPKVKAAVPINGPPFSTLSDQYINGELVEGHGPMLGSVDDNGFGNNTFDFKDGPIKFTPMWC